MADQISEDQILLNKHNVLLARSRAVLQSWVTAKHDESSNTPEDEDDESDLQGMREVAGLGAVNQDEDSELDGILKRKRTDQDKLLENLIGKKAAEARKKSQKAVAGKSMSMSRHAAPKSITSTASRAKVASRPQDSEDEDEEMGRAATFTSRKTRDTKSPAYATVKGESPVDVDPDAEPPDPREEPATLKELAKSEDTQETKPKKRKVGSYLDEVLGHNGKKSKKKKRAKEGGD